MSKVKGAVIFETRTHCILGSPQCSGQSVGTMVSPSFGLQAALSSNSTISVLAVSGSSLGYPIVYMGTEGEVHSLA